MHDILSPNMVVSPVAVALQPALKVAQEAFRTLPVAAQLEVKDHGALRPAVLPEVGLVVFASAIVHL
jgi:hypothetical protein